MRSNPAAAEFRLPLQLNRGASILPSRIHLATQALELDGQQIPWQKSFEDIEDLFALHRWGWLLRSLVEFPNINFCVWAGRALMEWTEKFMAKKNGPIWEAYSVSERIVNGILFYNCCSEYLEEKIRDKFVSTVKEHAQFLKNHLEYRGRKNTNNHFLNNARALYFAGQFLKNEELSESGRLIFINELPTMLTSAGFLREESSHYHFLLTRSVLEVWWAARETKDFDFANKIKSFAVKMIKRCHFFLMEDAAGNFTMPLVGDVSPDFPPDWLISAPFSKIAADLLKEDNVFFSERINGSNNWSQLFGNTLFVPASKHPVQEFYEADGWLRLNMDKATVFWPLKPDGTINHHGHNDLNSFCFYYQGEPILIDQGRYSYEKNLLGRYGRTAKAHNSLLIDGHEQYFLDWHGLMPKWALFDLVKITHEKTDRSLLLSIRTSHFSRTFRFKFDPNECVIDDDFTGRGRHSVASFFHASPNVKIAQLNDRRISIKSINHEFNLFISADEANIEIRNDYFFRSYGQKQRAKTIVCSTIKRFPTKITHVINW